MSKRKYHRRRQKSEPKPLVVFGVVDGNEWLKIALKQGLTLAPLPDAPSTDRRPTRPIENATQRGGT